MKILNITNGDIFNDYIKSIKEGEFIPFKEAMIEGNASYPILDDTFIQLRAKTHKVDANNYINHMNDMISLKENISNYNVIYLWFGKDVFCQINLITLLAYLDQIKFKGTIYLNLINEKNNKVIKKNIIINNDDFINYYKDVLINNVMVKTPYPFINKAIKQYLSYIENHDFILKYIKKYINSMDENELVCKLIELTKDLGLGDIQIKNIIEKYKKMY